LCLGRARFLKDIQAIDELVGDKLHDIVDAHMVDITMYDLATTLIFAFRSRKERAVSDGIAPGD
jgi:hypothetical protein